MKRKRTSTVTAWLLAVVVVFGGAAEIRAAVLCVGDDGHTDIEMLASFSCAEAARPTSDGSVPGLVAADSHCGDCVDLRLDARYLKAPKTSPEFKGTWFLRSLDADLGSDHPNLFVRTDLGVRESFPATQSSVVLLI